MDDLLSGKGEYIGQDEKRKRRPDGAPLPGGWMNNLSSESPDEREFQLEERVEEILHLGVVVGVAPDGSLGLLDEFEHPDQHPCPGDGCRSREVILWRESARYRSTISLLHEDSGVYATDSAFFLEHPGQVEDGPPFPIGERDEVSRLRHESLRLPLLRSFRRDGVPCGGAESGERVVPIIQSQILDGPDEIPVACYLAHDLFFRHSAGQSHPVLSDDLLLSRGAVLGCDVSGVS